MATLAVGADSLIVQVPAATPHSDDELLAFARLNPDLRVEQAPDGTLIVMAPAGGESGARNLEIALQLGLWARQDGTGIAFDSSTGFRLPASGSVRAPDASWVRLERWRALSPDERERFVPLCPDFVLELRSPSDDLDTLLDKMREYQRNGARLGLVLDPAARRVWVYGAGDAEPNVLEDPPTVAGDPVLPGFVLDLARVWRAGAAE